MENNDRRRLRRKTEHSGHRPRGQRGVAGVDPVRAGAGDIRRHLFQPGPRRASRQSPSRFAYARAAWQISPEHRPGERRPGSGATGSAQPGPEQNFATAEIPPLDQVNPAAGPALLKAAQPGDWVEYGEDLGRITPTSCINGSMAWGSRLKWLGARRRRQTVLQRPLRDRQRTRCCQERRAQSQRRAGYLPDRASRRRPSRCRRLQRADPARSQFNAHIFGSIRCI